MINCPKCNLHSRVIDTRYSPTSVPPILRRTRACPKCDRRWSTAEMMASAVETAKKRAPRRGRVRNNGTSLSSVIRREEYAAVANELRALAEKVENGGLRTRHNNEPSSGDKGGSL